MSDVFEAKKDGKISSVLVLVSYSFNCTHDGNHTCDIQR